MGTASVSPGPAVDSGELEARLGDGKLDVAARTGIRARRWSTPGTRMAALGAEALRGALDRAGLPASALRRVILVTSTGGEELIPSTASALVGELGLEGSCEAFDLNNACMGFLTAFDLAARVVATGGGPVGVVVTELLSRFIRPEDPRPYVVLADGVAAAVLGEGRPGEGVLAAVLGTSRALGHSTRLAHAGVTGARETIEFMASNRDLSSLAMATLVRVAREALDRAGVAMEDVAWVVPHQPNGRMLEGIVAALGVAPARIVPVVGEVGSVGAASIPISLDRLLRTRDVRPGDRILMVGVGAGVSYGAILYQVAPP